MNQKEAIEKALAAEKGIGKRQVLLKQLWKLRKLEDCDTRTKEAGSKSLGQQQRV